MRSFINTIYCIAAIILFSLGSYQYGKEVEKKESAAVAERLRQFHEIELESYIKNSREVSKLFEEVKRKHEKDLDAVKRDYTNRLRKSEQRAERYLQQAQGSTTDQYDLASHAAKLDRSVEEGRRLVTEFRSTLELRDSQVKSLATEITNLKTYFNE